MTNAVCLGLDTSNYTTSAAVFDGTQGENLGRLLDVPAGSLGLRQSEALFQHVKHLPDVLARLKEHCGFGQIAGVGASTRPRAVEGSYMPCFLVGEGQGRALATALEVPFFPCSHQQGHLAAAAWSANRMDLLDQPMLAWHLSGGTTELLYVQPEGVNVRAQRIGGTTDISAGQFIDRTGVLLGLDFPAGKALDALSADAEEREKPFPIKCNALEFSLSGMENKVHAMAERGEPPQKIAAFALDTVGDVICRVTCAAQAEYPGVPVLCSGGVASNTRLRSMLEAQCGAVFAESRFATDNALGVAVLAWRSLQVKGEQV